MRFRLSSVFTIAAVGSVLYAVYSIAGFGGFDPNSSSSTCVFPSVAVDIYAQTFPGWTYGLNETFTGDELLAKCADVCKKWKGTCRGIAKDSQKCLNSYTSKSLKVLDEVCGTESDRGVRRNCSRSLDADLADLKNFTKFDMATARDCCNEFEPRCITACFSGNATALYEPTCSGLDPIVDLVGCTPP
jgi:hypothetical protein